MSSKASTAIEHRRRVRRAFFHVKEQIGALPDRWPELSELAEVACMSPFHFIRAHRRVFRETPQATVRRIKLKRARAALLRDAQTVTDVAFEFGYASPQTFARAFRRQFGFAPSERRCMTTGGVELEFAMLPRFVLRGLDVQERNAPPWGTYDELVARLEHGGVERRDQRIFGVLDRHMNYRHACAAGSGMPALIGLREIVIGGGPCLRVKGQPPAVRALMRTCSIDLAGEERPLLLRYHNDPSYSDDDELSISLCLPLDPQARREDFEALAAALLKG